MDETSVSMDRPPAEARRGFDLRLALAAALLLPALWFTWLTVDGLAARRDLRTDLAELTHVRYGVLDADKWRDILAPILGSQIDQLDLKGQTKNLRPMVERSLYSLLDNIKKQIAAPGGNPLLSNPLMANMVNSMFVSLQPHVPEYADVVMAELAKPENQASFKAPIRSVLADMLKNTFSAVDMSGYQAILGRNHCANGEECERTLAKRIAEVDERTNRYYLVVLGSLVIGFVSLIVGRPISRPAVVVLMLFCLIALVGGLLSPMLEVEAKITRLDATLLGAPIHFGEQSLYYRSKNVIEVFQTLVTMGRPEMTAVGVLVLMFSVIFPALKTLSLCVGLIRPATLRTNRIVRFLAFESSKWSMADVMVLAIFMSFVAFNGLIGSAMDGLKDSGVQVAIPTNSSTILPGYYLFIGFCLASMFLSRSIEGATRGGDFSGLGAEGAGKA